MRTIKRGRWTRRIGPATLGVLALAATVGIGADSVALASPPTVTLSGYAHTGESPDGNTAHVTVNAVLSAGVATGTLSSEGKIEDPERWYRFRGAVTCMVVAGPRVTVGAFGTTWIPPMYGNGWHEEERPGYSQVLTVEFGEFESQFEEYKLVTFMYGLLPGYPSFDGLETFAPPSCQDASFDDLLQPTNNVFGGESSMHISPSITAPTDGHVSHGTVKLSGTAEPDHQLLVYEFGHESAGTDIQVSAKGKWSATLTGLLVGTHVFQALTVNGSEIPSNTVEVNVVPHAPTVETLPPSNVTTTHPIFNATVNPNGREVTNCHFAWGSTEAYEYYLGCGVSPGKGDSPVSVSASPFYGLGPGTYHYRIVATNSAGTSYGSDETFTTLN